MDQALDYTLKRFPLTAGMTAESAGTKGKHCSLVMAFCYTLKRFPLTERGTPASRRGQRVNTVL